jgi:prolyl-tRNA synthetase
MKQSLVYSPTLREVPADADIKSHQLLLRAGFIRQNASGIYSFLPLGHKVLQKVANIVREEMNKAGAMEMLMPSLQAQELWEESGRWENFGPELMRLRDRHGRGFALGATHEEVVTSVIRDELKSYKKLPITLYQIQSKFRDEKRPRFGLLRGREFMMKDAYSFHASQESLDEVYDRLFQAYSNIFTRCGLNFRAVVADSGAMGGKDTHEFMVLSDIGEDTIAFSTDSSYAANIEMAPVVVDYSPSLDVLADIEKVSTPNQKTIEEVTEFLNLPVEKSIKTLLFKADEEFVLVLVRGDHDINDIKLKNYLGANQVELADPKDVKEIMGCEIGSLGPVGVKADIKILVDKAVQAIGNGCCGANDEGYHYLNVNVNRDYTVTEFVDLRFIQEGDPSPDGKGIISFAKGIEVGHVFKLGTKYSESMNAEFLDQNGKTNPIIMGCYGIGVSRTLAAIVEQYNDEKGIVWPIHLAPFDVHVLTVNTKNEEQVQLADEIEKLLIENGQDVLVDDRNERIGVKFADADLFGIPIRITVGKRAAEGIVELKTRDGEFSKEVSASELINEIKNLNIKAFL